MSARKRACVPNTAAHTRRDAAPAPQRARARCSRQLSRRAGCEFSSRLACMRPRRYFFAPPTFFASAAAFSSALRRAQRGCVSVSKRVRLVTRRVASAPFLGRLLALRLDEAQPRQVRLRRVRLALRACRRV